MGQLTDALKTYKEKHPQIGLSESFQMTPLHAHVFNTIAIHDANSSEGRGRGADGPSVIAGTAHHMGIGKPAATKALADLGNAGMIKPLNSAGAAKTPSEVYNSPKLGNEGSQYEAANNDDARYHTPTQLGHATYKKFVTGN